MRGNKADKSMTRFGHRFHGPGPPPLHSSTYYPATRLSLCLVVVLLALFSVYNRYQELTTSRNKIVSESPYNSSSAQPSKQSGSGLYEESTYVTEITSEVQHKQYLSQQQPVLIIYYASWCAHCR
jgi:hypothetical protein